jgi:hypothetical protein
MSFTAYNVKSKRKETMVNPKLKVVKKGRRTTYMLHAKSPANGVEMYRIISHEQASNFTGRPNVVPPRKRSSLRRSSSKKRSRSASRKRSRSGSKKRSRSRSRKSRRSRSRKSKRSSRKSKRRSASKPHRKRKSSAFAFF